MISWVWSLIKLWFEILLVASFFHSFASHFMLWLEIRSRQLRNEPNANIPWKILLKNLLLETACTFAYLMMLPFAYTNSTTSTPRKSNPKTPPILLIHGYLHNQTDWLWFRHHLQSIDGIGPIFTVNLPLTQSIAEDSAIIGKKLAQINNTTGQDKVILVGHSRGGLVASYYTEQLAPENTVVSVITIGSPFSGTSLAVFGCFDNVKELAENAPILTKLKEHIQHSKVSYYHIGSKVDNLVVPWYSASPWQLRTTQNTVVFEEYGHLGLLLSSRVITKVVEWIFKGHD